MMKAMTRHLAITVLIAITNPTHAFVGVISETSVSTTVSQQGGSWSYLYSVTNSATCFGNCWDNIQTFPVLGYWTNLTNFYLPFFSDAGISNILSPNGWQYIIEQRDLFNLGQGASTLHWFTNDAYKGIAIDGTLGGFSYTADFSAAKAPFQTSLQLSNTDYLGDPPIPASPSAIAAGLPLIATVPLPSTILLLATGLTGLALNSKRHKQ